MTFRRTPNHKNLRHEFDERCVRLFDICKCKCKILSCDEAACGGCNDGAHVSHLVKCSVADRIPPLELSYILDQRRRRDEKGQQQIGGKDATETKKIQKRDDRKAKEQVRRKRIQDKKEEEEREEAENKERVKEFFSSEIGSDANNDALEASDPSYSVPSIGQSKPASTRNMQDLPHVA